MIGAVIVGAGSGERLGFGLPKALVPLGGRPMLHWSLDTFARHSSISVIVLVVPSGSTAESLDIAAQPVAPVLVEGGRTRQESVDRGLAALPADVDTVLVHDAARPLITDATISAVLAALQSGAEAVIPVLPMIDTVKRVDARGIVVATVPRADLRLVQTPQGFRRSVLVEAHRVALAAGDRDVSDDAGLVEALGVPVGTVPGAESAFKITTPHDLALAHRLLDDTADAR